MPELTFTESTQLNVMLYRGVIAKQEIVDNCLQNSFVPEDMTAEQVQQYYFEVNLAIKVASSGHYPRYWVMFFEPRVYSL
jgi:hypothetical protein